MIVSRASFDKALAALSKFDRLAVDTETTGLRPYHGARLFSLILAGPDGGYYFNFEPYPGLDPQFLLTPLHLRMLRKFFARPHVTWYAHNAKFDLHFLAKEGIEIGGHVHCTQAAALLEFNKHLSYSLAACAGRIGLKKDESVEEYIEKHKLFTMVTVPGRKARKKDKHFDKVPFEIIHPYGTTDAEITYRLGQYQEETFRELDAEQRQIKPDLPSLQSLHENEKRLTQVVFEMERVGIKINRAFCVRAAQYERDRAARCLEDYRRLTGEDFKDSGKAFAKVFASDRDRWKFTKKNNPSFESDILKTFENPAARVVLTYRDAKSKANFYEGFLWHADANDVVHPNLRPDGTGSGRFSSSEPNFQNLTSEPWGECTACGKELESIVDACPKCGSDKIGRQEFLVRRALIPRPGFVFIMPDYDQMEYRMMFDYACVGNERREPDGTPIPGTGETDLVRRIKAGHDPHQATADTVTELGTPLTRSLAKNGNFAWLYGAGIATLAATIRGTPDQARTLKAQLRQAAPEVQNFIDDVMASAQGRGFIFTWAGRRSWFQGREADFSYKAPNYLIQGGCADVMKIAMTQCADALRARGAKSRMVLTVHDELLLECHESETGWVPGLVKDIMERVYPARYLPLTAAMEYSEISFADKRKGAPSGEGNLGDGLRAGDSSGQGSHPGSPGGPPDLGGAAPAQADRHPGAEAQDPPERASIGAG